MLHLKKDWLYSVKIIFACFGVAQISFVLLGMILSPYELSLMVIRHIYRNFNPISVIFVMIYPVYALKMISPRRSNFFDAQLTTAGLPFTKKQLFFRSMKHWLYLAPLYLMMQTLISYFLSVKLVGVEFITFFYNDIFNPLFAVLLLAAIVLQSMAAIICCLADNIKWYWLLISMVIGNMVYIYASAAMLGRIGAIFLNEIPKVEMLYIPMFILIIISAIIFKANFNKIEKIYQ